MLSIMSSEDRVDGGTPVLIVEDAVDIFGNLILIEALGNEIDLGMEAQLDKVLEIGEIAQYLFFLFIYFFPQVMWISNCSCNYSFHGVILSVELLSYFASSSFMFFLSIYRNLINFIYQ